MNDTANGKDRRPRTVLVVALAAVAVHFIALLLFHAEPVGSERREADRSDVTLPPFDGNENHSLALREQAALFDSTPLFLPTRWNAVSEHRVQGLSQEPEGLFSPFSPDLSLENVRIGKAIEPEVSPDTLEVFAGFETPLFGTFAPGGIEPPRLDERSAHLEVVSVASGERVFSVSLDDDLPGSDPFWAPLVFGVQITPVGLAGSPVLLEGSGVDEIDTYFATYLEQEIFSRRLPEPGYYRVLIGP